MYHIYYSNTTEISIKMTTIFSIFVSGAMYVLAEDFSQIIYKTNDCTEYIRILAPLIPIMYLDMMVDGLLKGLDQQLYSMRYNIFDSGLCVILVYFLIPKYSIKGYIAILFISEIINFILSIRRLSQVTNLKIDILNSILKPIAATFLSGVGTVLLFISNEITTINLIFKILVIFIFYLIIMFFLKSINKHTFISEFFRFYRK